MSPSPSPHAQSTIAGRYTIQRKLGAGSLGTVYLAHDERAGHAVALKILRTDRLSTEAVQRFQREFGTLASLQHPRIAAAHDFGYSGAGDLPFYTREYIEGTPLPAGPPGAVHPRDFLKPILDLLEALEYLHRHGILHLDIHPGNLIVARDAARGSVLIDFGLFHSRVPLEPTFPTQVLSPLPPEILGGDRLSPATDVFLAGRLLLYRLSGEALSEARLPREIPGWGMRLTLEIERIAAKALEADPARRFSSAAELHDALARALGNLRAAAGPPEPSAAIVGREAELARIEEELQAALAGKGAVLCLRGPCGLGKTRLLSQARVRAQLLGLETLEVRFYPDGGPGSTLTGALGGGPATGAARRRPSWVEALDARHGGTPEERARRAAKGYFDDTGRALAFILDDLDRADRSSSLLAEALLIEASSRRGAGEEGRGLCILCSTSSKVPPGVDRRQVLTLRPLPPREARRLLAALTHPLQTPDELAARGAARARGSPLRLHQLAQLLLAEWGRAGAVPAGAELPELSSDPIDAGLAVLPGVKEAGRRILRALAVLAQPASSAGIAFALGLEPALVQAQLRRLEQADLVTSLGRGTRRLFQVSRPEASAQLRRGVSPGTARRLHHRTALFLESCRRLGLREEESLARHLLLCGRKAAGLRRASRAAIRLRRSGHHERAVAVLEEALAHEPEAKRRFPLLEELSEVLEEIGDHERGASLLEAFFHKAALLLSPAEAIRLRRRLGIHFHRSGRVGEAVKVFEEAQRAADQRRDREELVMIESELAELHTLRGSLEEADQACRQGLARLDGLRSGDPFRARMEVVLRASRGHLELRRLRLEDARGEFRAALRLSRRFRMPATRAVILNNLGITENQLHHIPEARRAFREAERLFISAGEKRSVILIACNLAVIAAKLGEREEARLEIERAERLLKKTPGERIEFYTAYCRGIAASLLGDAEAALESLPQALTLGRRLGDRHLVGYGESYLAEGRIACGRYHEAWKQLRSLAGGLGDQGPPILRRMVQSRLFFLAVLLGRPRDALAARKAIEETPRTDLLLLEAWNDLFAGLARLLAGEAARTGIEAAREVFHDLGVVAGESFARILLLLEPLAREDRTELERGLPSLEEVDTGSHRFLAVARPLLLAEAHAVLGHAEEAKEWLSDASGAIIGSPFLELDWRIELLRARLAQRAGDARSARTHLHHALHTRNLLLEHLPRLARERFLSHPRFRRLEALADRLERSPRLHFSSRRGDATSFEGLVGRSAEMLQVFHAIDRLRDQEIPVLITGEIGTGKELVARALHRQSPRSRAPYFALHAGALPTELFESELCGYEKGAFTGAEEARPGLLESLAGGTLLLDEVSDLAPAAQAKLLRFLDTGRVRRLGGLEERQVDVRLLASTSADLRARVKERAFREDLLFRLAGMEIRLPPLRDRKGDIALLAGHFIELHSRRLDRPAPVLESEAVQLLEGLPWPGNVRELEGWILRALACLAPHRSRLGVEEMEPLLPEDQGPGEAEDERLLRDLFSRDPPLDELKVRVERLYCIRLFRKLRGDPRKMMQVLGVKQSYFYGRLKEIGIDIRTLRERLFPESRTPDRGA